MPHRVRTRRRGAASVVATIVAVAVLVGCSGSDDTRGSSRSSTSTTAPPRPTSFPIAPARSATPDALRAATARAAGYLAAHMDEIDPASLAVVDYVGRKWGWTQLASASTRARALLAAGDHRGSTEVLDRLVDPAAPAPTPAQLRRATATERLLARALACTPATVPAVRRQIERRSRLGGYETTHAAWALRLLEERCPRPAADRARRASVVQRLQRELDADRTSNDITIERMAMLVYLGEKSRIPEARVRAVLGAQAPDGGWGEEPGVDVSWHPTVLALWALSGILEPGADVPFVAR